MVSELFEFNSAVRGYHYYQKYWQPEGNERLFCAHEADNPSDCFVIRTYVGSTGKTGPFANGDLTSDKVFITAWCDSICNFVINHIQKIAFSTRWAGNTMQGDDQYG